MKGVHNTFAWNSLWLCQDVGIEDSWKLWMVDYWAPSRRNDRLDEWCVHLLNQCLVYLFWPNLIKITNKIFAFNIFCMCLGVLIIMHGNAWICSEAGLGGLCAWFENLKNFYLGRCCTKLGGSMTLCSLSFGQQNSMFRSQGAAFKIWHYDVQDQASRCLG